jgi:hypothetical protein
MSALGQERTLSRLRAMSAISPKADIAERGQNVCMMVPYADIKLGRAIFNGSIPMKVHGQCHCGAIAYEAGHYQCLPLS